MTAVGDMSLKMQTERRQRVTRQPGASEERWRRRSEVVSTDHNGVPGEERRKTSWM